MKHLVTYAMQVFNFSPAYTVQTRFNNFGFELTHLHGHGHTAKQSPIGHNGCD